MLAFYKRDVIPKMESLFSGSIQMIVREPKEEIVSTTTRSPRKALVVSSIICDIHAESG